VLLVVVMYGATQSQRGQYSCAKLAISVSSQKVRLDRPPQATQTGCSNRSSWISPVAADAKTL
jgi:hypothetical protein